MWIQPSLEVCESAHGRRDSDLIPVFQDSSKKPVPPKGEYADLIQKLKKSQAFNASKGSTLFLRFGGKGGAENCFLIGLGGKSELSEEKIRSLGGSIWQKCIQEKIESICVHADLLKDVRSLRVLAEGMILPAYGYDKYKTTLSDSKKEKQKGPEKIIFFTSDKSLKKKLEKELSEVQSLGFAVNLTRDWSNEPSNVGTPEYYASESKKLAKQYGLKCKVLTEADAKREKMGLFLGVGQGSEREGRVVILEYIPKGIKNPKTIAFVGKGVTFDSGGISIKPSLRMEEMKHDMTGAATLMGATVLASQWKVPNRIVAVLAFTENMPDGGAINPGNILTARNGKTVEIINTDAEGRLVLADALDLAQDYKPDVVIDAATLTGAVSVALGKYCCAILGNDENLMESLKKSGEVHGERIWQLPLFDDYFDDLKSDYADIKNSVNDSNGGTIRGAMFLKQFIRKGTKWAHLDIASTAYNISHVSYYPKKGASGAYVRTLAQFAREY